MNLGILRSKRHSVTNWHLRSEPAAPSSSLVEKKAMETNACPFIKQEICNGVFWVTNDCAQGIKEGFRPRVAFQQACERCRKDCENKPQK